MACETLGSSQAVGEKLKALTHQAITRELADTRHRQFHRRVLLRLGRVALEITAKTSAEHVRTAHA